MKYVMLTLALLLSAATSAGFTNHYTVNVNTSGSTAYGSFIGARQSADNSQYIYCAYAGFSTSPYGICGARDNAGNTAYCTTTDSNHIEQIRGLSNESYIYMQWNSSGRCTYIYSSTGSMFHQ